jgi:hypothetical protein
LSTDLQPAAAPPASDTASPRERRFTPWLYHGFSRSLFFHYLGAELAEDASLQTKQLLA